MESHQKGNCLMVFLKEPVSGKVKTRLAESIGPDQACKAYLQMVDVLLNRLKSFPDIHLLITDTGSGFDLSKWKLNPQWKTCAQSEGDLGFRMSSAFRDSFDQGYDKVLLIGSDCPEVGKSDLEMAFNKLEESDLVLGPSRDGGYWLIGMNALHQTVFKGISWSTEIVLQQTLKQAEKERLSCSLLRTLTDIDTVLEWREYEHKREKEYNHR
jgi:hypothetical protein